MNNIVEQDHRFIQKSIRPMLGFKNFQSAKIILAEIEVMHMIFKNQSGYMPLFHQDPIDAYWTGYLNHKYALKWLQPQAQ